MFIENALTQFENLSLSVMLIYEDILKSLFKEERIPNIETLDKLILKHKQLNELCFEISELGIELDIEEKPVDYNDLWAIDDERADLNSGLVNSDNVDYDLAYFKQHLRDGIVLVSYEYKQIKDDLQKKTRPNLTRVRDLISAHIIIQQFLVKIQNL